MEQPAIGDGGNDRLLMKHANFGIGVSQGNSNSLVTLYSDAVIPKFGMLPRILQYHCVNADTRFQGLMQMNTVLSMIPLICLALLVWLARFSATDFMDDYIFGTHLISLTVIYRFLAMLLLANYVVSEQPLPSRINSTDVCSESPKNSSIDHDVRGCQGLNTAWKCLWKYRKTLSRYPWRSVLSSSWKGLSAGLVVLLLFVDSGVTNETGEPQGTFSQLGAQLFLACSSLAFASAIGFQRLWPWPSVVLHSILITVSGILVYLLAQDFKLMDKDSLELIGPLHTASWKFVLLSTMLATVIGVLPDLLFQVMSLCGLSCGSMIDMHQQFRNSNHICTGPSIPLGFHQKAHHSSDEEEMPLAGPRRREE